MGDSMKKMLRLVIEVPDYHADDLEEMAAIYADGGVADDRDRMAIIEEWMRTDVGLFLVGIPGDKCLNDDFSVMPVTGTIVGASIRDR